MSLLNVMRFLHLAGQWKVCVTIYIYKCIYMYKWIDLLTLFNWFILGCPEQKKVVFLKNLMNFLKNEMVMSTNRTGLMCVFLNCLNIYICVLYCAYHWYFLSLFKTGKLPKKKKSPFGILSCSILTKTHIGNGKSGKRSGNSFRKIVYCEDAEKSSPDIATSTTITKSQWLSG